MRRLVQAEDRSKLILRWLVAGLLYVLIVILQLFGVATLIGASDYIAYLVRRGTEFDVWAALSILGAVLPLVALVGAVWAIWQRRLPLALAFSVLALPMMFIIEGSRCDTESSCRLMGWAALPAGAGAWSVRIRPVTDPNEAKGIASSALFRAHSKDSTFRAKRFADHWIVSTIDDDGWPGAHAVRIDTRTGQTRLIACPKDKIQCGMERPAISDGRSAFRNDRAGIAAVFPAPRPVCTLRGYDDEPRGFAAMVRAPDIPCEIVEPSREMGVELARDPRDECAMKQAKAPPWRPLSSETARLFRKPPTLDGQPSFACELHINDQIQVGVYARAMSGRLYEGYIVTTPDHLAEDVRSFELFLRSVRIDASA